MPAEFQGRIEAFDWERIERDLDARGCAVIERLVDAADCAALVALYAHEEIFRSRVVMARHGYGRGEYKYFAYPLSSTIAGLNCLHQAL